MVQIDASFKFCVERVQLTKTPDFGLLQAYKVRMS